MPRKFFASTESLVVNSAQVINNKSDLTAPTQVTFQYQAVSATERARGNETKVVLN
ncbi:MAG: hypothetical protein ACHQAX_09755 [Gammaproteobacteria bacterium]